MCRDVIYGVVVVDVNLSISLNFHMIKVLTDNP